MLQTSTDFATKMLYNVIEVIIMLLNFLIWINKRKLDKMINHNYSYDEILKQSQKLDFLINIWMKNNIRFKKRA